MCKSATKLFLLGATEARTFPPWNSLKRPEQLHGRSLPGLARGSGSARLGTVRRHRTRGKKIVSLPRERLPDLFREDRRRHQGPPRVTQKHVPRFSFSEQIAGLRRRSIRRDARVLEAYRGRREDAESVG